MSPPTRADRFDWMRARQKAKRQKAPAPLALRSESVSRRYHKVHDKMEAVYRRMRAEEVAARECDLAFRFPIFWFCWRSQCSKVRRK